MPKPKDEEADNKSDGLEIISIGSLYTGPWDKKYWSSSRGKDRYPYPVGYHALRAYNGSTYKMEIHEGPKGPLFVISCDDGNSCSGQTPDIAWEKFQKKGFSRMSIWHGKRFSCKIDGIEFFGFKNQFVQRLLRELVAKINGIEDCSALPSSFCDRAYAIGCDDHHEDTSAHPDLLPYLARAGVTGKRSRRRHIPNANSTNIALSKKLRPENPLITANVSNLVQRNHEQCNLLANSTYKFSENLDETKLVCPEIRITSTSGDKLSAQRKPLDRLEDTEAEGSIWPTSVDDRAVDALISKESREIHGVDLYAPDTLDVVEDGLANSPTITQDKSSCAKEELNVTDAVVCEGLVSSSHQEEEKATSNSNASYEKSDSDSAGQDIAKSMMTLLLPQAIPLLKKSPRKNVKTIGLLEDLHPLPKSHKENHRTDDRLEVQSPRIEHSVDPSSVHSKSVIPDSFDDPCGDIIATNELMFPSENAEAYKSSSDENNNKQDAGTKIDAAEDLKSKPEFNEAVATSNSSRICSGSSVQSLTTGNVNQVGATEVGNQSTSSVPKKFYARKKDLRAASTTHKGNSPKSTGILLNSLASQIISSVENADDAGIERQVRGVSTDKNAINSDSMLDSMGPIMSKTQAVSLTSEQKDSSHSVQFPVEKVQDHYHDRLVAHDNDAVSAQKEETVSCENGISDAKKSQINSDAKLNRHLEIDNELQGSYGLIGCYFHPFPVSSLLSMVNGTEIYICVLCGHLGDKERTLFLYKLSIEESRIGHPSFVGYTSVTWASSVDIFGREILLERSGFQLTPDGHCLVLLGNIRTPYCREGRSDCLCSTCTSECLEHNTVKIVQIKAGYVSLLIKVRTIDSLQCLLVCEPNYLVAAGESGRLHLWTMNPTWSATAEEFVISTKDYIFPCILELKRLPQCASLVIGHNGFGDFTVWDILKRTVMSRFSSPSTSVRQFFPISLFSWQKEFNGFIYSNMEKYINEFMDVNKLWLSEPVMNHSNMQLEGEDIAVCLLISGDSDFDVQPNNLSNDVQIPAGCWRLALLVKNMLILGSTLDPRATAAGTSSSCGIIGTLDGQVYAWNLLTGTKLGNIHQFKGGSVSCIATDDSSSGILAVADDTGQLLVYRCLENVANC